MLTNRTKTIYNFSNPKKQLEDADSTKLMSLTTNIGDAKSMITHPASTTHTKMTKENRLRIGVIDQLVRISVGLENVEDIISDLNQSLSIL